MRTGHPSAPSIDPRCTGITAVVVQTHQLTRSALRALLEARGLIVLGEAGTIDQACVSVAETAADVLISDVDVAGHSMISALPSLRAASPRTRVVILTSTHDLCLHARALDAGATAVVPLEHSADVLMDAIKTIQNGSRWLGLAEGTWGRTFGRMPRRSSMDDPETTKIRSLTRREHDIVRLVAEGLNNLQIAGRLFISQATVRNHLTSILDKLDLSNRFELAVYSFRQGLVSYPRPFESSPVPHYAVK
jgi:DNA-binding NarL/FixJ family response regulator